LLNAAQLEVALRGATDAAGQYAAAQSHEASGRHEAAEHGYTAALALRRDVLHAHNALVGQTVHALAALAVLQQQAGPAQALLAAESVAALRHRFPASAPCIAFELRLLAAVRRLAGDQQGAANAAAEASAILALHYGPDEAERLMLGSAT
jgi:hypothetical protein